VVIARGFARIHHTNLINYGILPLVFVEKSTYEKLEMGDVLVITGLHKQLKENGWLEVHVPNKDFTFTASYNLSARMIDVLLSGGLTNWVR
jgi:aconitate hydratase